MLKTMEDYLQVALDQGYSGATLEQMGGGVICVWIPLDNPVYEYALMDCHGLGLFVYEYACDDYPMYLFNDNQENPTYAQALDGFEWMEKTLEAERKEMAKWLETVEGI
jgi:hypothetical protein